MGISGAVAALVADTDILAIALLRRNQLYSSIARRDNWRTNWGIIIDTIVMLANVQYRMNAPAEAIIQAAIGQWLVHEIFGHRGAILVEVIRVSFNLVSVEALALAVRRELDKDQFRISIDAFPKQEIDFVDSVSALLERYVVFRSELLHIVCNSARRPHSN